MTPPAGLRRYLGFTKLSTAAVEAIARVVDQDDDFRAKVAAAVDEDAVGRGGWLWLTRPEGWADELAKLEEEATAIAAANAEVREERDARRRLAAARAAAERATAAATAREQENATVRAELLEERATRRAAETRLGELETELELAREERQQAVRELKETEQKLARRAAEAKDLKARLQSLETSDHSGPQIPRQDAAFEGQNEVVGPALERAARGAEDLAVVLNELREVLNGTAEDDATRPCEERGDLEFDDHRSVDHRTPLTLPGGVRDDSVEAADFLMRARGMLLLVDGYNVSMTGWPELPIREQRRRLLAALYDTAARCGACADVVFDGAENGADTVPQHARRYVRVRFSPPDVEADDVLLDLVAELPPARPVVVASSDNRVRDGSKRLGANLLHARQLLALLRG